MTDRQLPSNPCNTGWLIERLGHPGIYFSPGWRPDHKWEWITTDPNEAVRFARQEDANRAKSMFHAINSTFFQGTDWVATEHVWLDSRSDETPVCVYESESGDTLTYETGCGNVFRLDPVLELYEFCPYCGKRVSVCSTCNGTREIDETLGGISTSNPHAPCPDCTRPRPALKASEPPFDVPAREEFETWDEYRKRLQLFGIDVPPSKASEQPKPWCPDAHGVCDQGCQAVCKRAANAENGESTHE